MFQWLEELHAALNEEFGSSTRVATLATVERSGAPRARSIVCRWIDEEGRLFIASDARSDKDTQLRGEHRCELVFWLPKMRTQFRIAGDVRIVAFPEDETLRKDVWRGMSDEARSLFFWPTPGVAADTDDGFATAVSADVAPPRNFEVLVLQPRQVDRLALSSHPHRRRVWRYDTNWSGVDINP